MLVRMRRSDAWGVGALAGLILASAGCGNRGLRVPASSDARPSSDAATVDGGEATEAAADDTAAAGFVERMAAVMCDAIAPCCASAGFAHDPAACTADLAFRLYDRFPNGLGGLVRYDSAAEATCLKDVAETVGRCTGPSVLSGVGTEPALSDCARVIVGTVPLGGACSSSEDCDSSAGPVGCQTAPRSAEMRCVSQPPPDPVPRPVLLIGQPCTAMSSLESCDSYCEAGTFCDVTGTCAAKHASGTCADTCRAACTDANYCDITSHTCLPRIPAGAACSNYSSCARPNVSCFSGVCAADVVDLCTGVMK